LGAVDASRAEERARDDPARHLVGYALAIAAASFWGVGGVLAKLAFARGIAPAELAQVRIGLGFLLFAAIVAISRPSAARVRREHVPLLVAFGVIGLAGVQLSYYEAIKRLPVVLALLVQYLGPLIALVYFWLRGRHVGGRLWLAALLTIVGSYLALGAYDANLLELNLEGALVAMLSALLFAFYLITGERIVRVYSALTLLLYGFGAAAVAWTALRPWWTLPFGSWDATTYLLIAAVAVVATVVPFFLSSRALSILPATRVGLAQTTEPVVAAIVAFAVLGESLAAAQLAGAALVLSGIALARSVQPTIDGV
jgi:drug/metabolite transporter (DMT)-like permease